MSGPVTDATVGTTAGILTVRVKDANGQPLPGVVVNFTVSLGGGSVAPVADTSRADGTASSALRLGTVPGQHQVTATVGGVAPLKSSLVTAVVGPGIKVATSALSLRYPLGTNSRFVGATVRDSLGNGTGAAVTWTSRNPALVSVTPGNGNNATIQVVSRPGLTFVVATAGSVSDSIRIAVLDATSTPCTFAASATVLSVGASVTFDTPGVVCIRADEPGAEYALVAHYGTPAGSALLSLEVGATGLVAPAPLVAPTLVGPGAATGPEADVSFESALRRREQVEMPGWVSGARAWFDSRPAALSATAREGDVTSLNVSASGFCTRENFRGARVVAITNTALILADTTNPPGGFTDAEYREFGTVVDTLVSRVDTAAFGTPTDIDGNGRVAILFTRGVNELTAPGTTSGVVLGFFYSRDLLPRVGPAGTCPASNVSEMFYVLVPDPGGVASDPRSKEFVQSVVIGTIAHEYQHLINASRRLYLNKAGVANEETWLNEGLSHIAEELVFYRSAKREPRQNLTASDLLPGSDARTAFDTFLRANFGRYQQYLRSPDLSSPVSPEDALATRGAAWAFLRYVADRAGTTDGDLWYRLVNSPLSGTANMDGALTSAGLSALSLLRDWSVSVLADDYVPGSSAVFQQPSWNFISAMPAVGFPFALVPGVLVNGLTYTTNIRGGGTSYSRFSVAQDQEALVQVTGAGGRPLPAGARLLVVRTR